MNIYRTTLCGLSVILLVPFMYGMETGAAGGDDVQVKAKSSLKSDDGIRKKTRRATLSEVVDVREIPKDQLQQTTSKKEQKLKRHKEYVEKELERTVGSKTKFRKIDPDYKFTLVSVDKSAYDYDALNQTNETKVAAVYSRPLTLLREKTFNYAGSYTTDNNGKLIAASKPRLDENSIRECRVKNAEELIKQINQQMNLVPGKQQKLIENKGYDGLYTLIKKKMASKTVELGTEQTASLEYRAPAKEPFFDYCIHVETSLTKDANGLEVDGKLPIVHDESLRTSVYGKKIIVGNTVATAGLSVLWYLIYRS